MEESTHPTLKTPYTLCAGAGRTWLRSGTTRPCKRFSAGKRCDGTSGLACETVLSGPISTEGSKADPMISFLNDLERVTEVVGTSHACSGKGIS